VLGLAPSMRAGRLLISAAVLSLLAAAADHRPVLCLVDDAQWVDRPSADALAFAARRLRAEPMAFLFGARDGAASLFEAARMLRPDVAIIDVAPAADTGFGIAWLAIRDVVRCRLGCGGVCVELRWPRLVSARPGPCSRCLR
jgi:hypothetical protein